MRHRVFIAINLPDNIKDELVKFQEKWHELPVRWTKKENLHITLEFLGYLTDEELMEAYQRIKEITEKKKSFSVNLNKICYGPPYQNKFGTGQAPKKPPRMIWATAAPFCGASLAFFGRGDRIKEFNLVPHITLGRIKAWQFRQIEPNERPEINEDIDLSFEVDSIEIMESQLRKSGPEYTILESYQLKN